MTERISQEWLETISKTPEAATLVDVGMMADELIEARLFRDAFVMAVIQATEKTPSIAERIAKLIQK